MKILRTYPPNYAVLKRAFDLPPDNVIFAWGDVIYAPGRQGPVTPALLDHEAVHGVRQLAHAGGIEGWWRDYVADPAFRLAEEIPAHVAEYAWHVRYEGRRARERALDRIGMRLSSSLYGRLLSFDAAKAMLVERTASDKVAVSA